MQLATPGISETSGRPRECPGGPVAPSDNGLTESEVRGLHLPRNSVSPVGDTRLLSPRARPSSANVRLAQPVEGCGCGHTVSRAESAHLARYQTAQADP